jgi:hypothetical protein
MDEISIDQFLSIIFKMVFWSLSLSRHLLIDGNHFGRPGTVTIGGDHAVLHVGGSTIADFGGHIRKLHRVEVDVPAIANIYIRIAADYNAVRDVRRLFAGQEFASDFNVSGIRQANFILFIFHTNGDNDTIWLGN